ncbi:hypothetical protein [Nocardia sp. Marseille-Q1738]
MGDSTLNAIASLLHLGGWPAVLGVGLWRLPEITDFVERIVLPLLPESVCDRKIRLAKVEKRKSK